MGFDEKLSRRAICGLLSAAFAFTPLFFGDTAAWAQFPSGRGGYGYGRPYRPPAKFPQRDIFPGSSFTFCTVWFQSVRRGPSGFGWNTDYPAAGDNFMIRLDELTTISINREPDGQPLQVVVKLTDEELFDYPFIFMSDVGKAGFSDEEAAGLRSYLLRGGFLLADDFWGSRDWDNFAYEIGRALPPDEFPIVDLPLSHEIFHIVFNVKEVPQVPSIHHWRRNRENPSELGYDSAEPHCRGIFDKNGRLIIVFTHNTDIADGWEREGEDEEYFQTYSAKMAYPLGINIVVYAMTH